MSDIKNKGLSDREVIESREQNGDNVITPSERVSLWKLYFEKFEDPMIRILLFAVVLSLIIAFIHNDFTEVIGVTLAVFLATSIGFWFEWDASKKFDVLNALGDEAMVKVRRNGEIIEVFKKDIVVGDVVLLESGEEIPADGELLESVSLMINESTLTGEPSIAKTTDAAHFKKDATYLSNHLLRGTTVIEGNCEMVVLRVGDNTEFGKVTRLATQKSEEKTPLTHQLDNLARLISVVGAIFSFLVFVTLYLKGIFLSSQSFTFGQSFMLVGLLLSIVIVFGRLWLKVIADANALAHHKEKATVYLAKLGWWFWISAGVIVFGLFGVLARNYGIDVLDLQSWITLETAEDILNSFMIAVTLIVVAVPEGLPMSVTLSLALNMRRMLKTNNLVRKMHASETMGAITVICTDKTGTLTQNQMRVSRAEFFMSESNGLSADKEAMIVEEAISVNTTAHLDRKQTPVKTMGNPTEASLLLWLNDSNVDYMKRRLEVKVLDQITFSTKNKYMATLIYSNLWKSHVVYLKGAPEVVLSKCSTINIKGEVQDITPYREEIESKLLGHQNRAQRTLAFAYKKIENSEAKCKEVIDSGDLVLMGIVAISDPVRPDVKDAVKEVHMAGVDVKIVTGDTPATAVEIARQIGIWDDKKHNEFHRITGVDFEALSDEELLKRVEELKIISRARPADKQRLVELLQKCGSVVAVTGDGTNDAPALNFAHVGLSMGSGTSVAKEASDITLIDDSFRSISTAVMWGRSLYKNIQRFLFFQLTINAIALTIVLVGAFVGREVPLTITQMLWVNLIMDTFAAAALASLPPSHNVMRDKPRKRKDFIITSEMRRGIFLMAGFQFVILMLLLYYIDNIAVFEVENYGMTLFFSTFVMMQFWNLFNAKSFLSGSESAFKDMAHNSGFILVALIIIIGQILIVSFGGAMFRCVPLSAYHWIVIIASTSVILWAGEIMRFFKRMKVRRGEN